MIGRSNATIERNLVIDNDDGIEVLSSRIQIQNNTIANNAVGIRVLRLFNPMSITRMSITRNNIQNNTQNSIYLEETTGDVNATLNWWGTADTQIINLTIHDRKSEPKLGNVSFVPTLSEPVPEAPTTEYTPISRSPLLSQETTTTTPNQTNTQPAGQIGIIEIAIATIILSVIINISLAIMVAVLLKKRH